MSDVVVKVESVEGPSIGVDDQSVIKGDDGFSPVVSFEQIEGGYKLIIVDAQGAHEANILNGAPGQDGSPGPQGIPGADGQDGASPAVTFGVISGGHTMTITDKTHPTGQTINIMDGAPGAQGIQGEKGDKGDTGAVFTPSVDSHGNISWSNDGGLPNPETQNIKGPQGDPGNYTKPATGIPKSDLASDVQASLNKADSALQSVPSTYRTAAAQDTIDAGKQAKIAASGILKGDGNGGVIAATAGTDYQAPLVAGTDYETPAGAKALGLTGASAGDLVRVNSVDANGKPTSWKHVPLCEIKTNSNLLDNWYFINPVNQRGQSSYSNTAAYTIDRWKLTSGSVSVVTGGITLNGTLVQILPTGIGLPVVASALLSDGTMITPTYNDSTKTLTLTATGQTIVAVKLEIGTEQTLSHQENGVWVLNEVPDYNEQLTKCRQYFRVLEASPGVGNGQYIIGIRGYSVASTVKVSVEPPMAKIITPSLPSGLQGAAVDGAGTAVSLSDVASTGSNKSFAITIANNLARTPISVYFNNIIYLSAEL